MARDDVLVLKEVPGLGASLDCASTPRRSLHPPSLQRTPTVMAAHGSSQPEAVPHREDRKDLNAVSTACRLSLIASIRPQEVLRSDGYSKGSSHQRGEYLA